MLYFLPDELVKELVQVWLGLEEWIRLDFATCSKLWRGQLLEIFHGLSTECADQDYYRYTWMMSRNIFVLSFVLDEVVKSWSNNILVYLCKEATHLEVQDMDELENVASIINTCSKLTSLKWSFTNSLSSLNVDLVSRLQELDMPVTADDEKVICDHCRELRSLKQQSLFDDDDENILSLDVFRLNPHIHTLEVITDSLLVSDMAQGHYPSLTSLTLNGEHSFSSVATLLRNNKNIIEFQSADEFLCEYRKDDGYFSVDIGLPEGWAEFAQEINNLETIEWWLCNDCEAFMQLVTGSFESLGTVLLGMQWPDDDCIKYLLDNCEALETLSLSFGSSCCDWSDVLNENNSLTDLTIIAEDPDVVYILSTCHHLRRLAVTGVKMDVATIHTLVDLIRNYKNEDFTCFLNDRNRKRCVSFHSDHFHGDGWTEYCELMNIFKDQGHDNNKELHDAVAALEESLAQKKEVNLMLLEEIDSLKSEINE